MRFPFGLLLTQYQHNQAHPLPLTGVSGLGLSTASMDSLSVSSGTLRPVCCARFSTRALMAVSWTERGRRVGGHRVPFFSDAPRPWENKGIFFWLSLKGNPSQKGKRVPLSNWISGCLKGKPNNKPLQRVRRQPASVSLFSPHCLKWVGSYLLVDLFQSLESVCVSLRHH